MLLNAGVSRYFEDNFKTSFPCYFFAKTFCLDYFLRFSKKVIRTSINHYRGGKISTQSSILCTFSINPKFFFFCPLYPPLCCYVSVFFLLIICLPVLSVRTRDTFWKSLEYFL